MKNLYFALVYAVSLTTDSVDACIEVVVAEKGSIGKKTALRAQAATTSALPLGPYYRHDALITEILESGFRAASERYNYLERGKGAPPVQEIDLFVGYARRGDIFEGVWLLASNQEVALQAVEEARPDHYCCLRPLTRSEWEAWIFR